MQGSDTMQTGTTHARVEKKTRLRGWKLAAVILVAFLVLNGMANLLLTPAASSGMQMWRGYAGQESLDLVFAGSSQCISGLRPDVITEETGWKAYNMGSNMQSLESSAFAIRSAAAEKGVTKAVLVLDYELLSQEPKDNFRPDASFMHARTQMLREWKGSFRGFWQGVPESLRFIGRADRMTTTASLCYFFPWTYDRDDHVLRNLRQKFLGATPDPEDMRDVWGFLPSDQILNTDEHYVTLEEASEFDKTADLTVPTISDSNRKLLESLLRDCRDQGITLTGITVPYANFISIYPIDGYTALHHELTELFAKYGYSYYDFNLIRPEYYQAEMSGYKDNGHMNTEGATAFSSFLGSFLLELEEQPDPTALSDRFILLEEYL